MAALGGAFVQLDDDIRRVGRAEELADALMPPASRVEAVMAWCEEHDCMWLDDALEALCDLFVACEALGLFPAQLTWMVMPMLPKAAGGHRLIILYSMAYRVWQRMRKYALKPIADRLRRPFWGAAVGRSATDSARILAADAEQNVSNGISDFFDGESRGERRVGSKALLRLSSRESGGFLAIFSSCYRQFGPVELETRPLVNYKTKNSQIT